MDPSQQSADSGTRGTITQLLREMRAGDGLAVERLYPLIYERLHQLAHLALRHENTGHTLATTDLVHEAYLRLVDQTRVEWQDRGHFFAIASRAMRRILVDYARRHVTAKRGGAQRPVTLDESAMTVDDRADTVVLLNDALTRLAAVDERQAKVVELRFFGGLTEAEAAEVLGITARTVRRDWVDAKAWLYRELGQ
jgi:RNA polymerase sigma factor (TIGR02999 family)